MKGRSLASFFYNMIGKMDEQLNKERQEAYAARVKYEAAARELEAVEEDLRRSKAELSGLRGCDRRYVRFADYFLDGLFADWAVLDKINQSQSQVQSTVHKIESVLPRLNSMEQSAETEQTQTRAKLDTLVKNMKV